MKHWLEYSLSKLCSNITDGKHGDCQNEKGSGYYFVSVKDVYDGKIHYVNSRQITKSDFEETHRRTQLEADDILITNSGTIGRMVLVKKSDLTEKTTFQKSVAIIKPIPEKVVSVFLYYYLLSEKKRLSEFAGGTTQKNLLLRDLKNFKVRLPDKNSQVAISTILKSLDDKIEINTRMNKVLEEIARALFHRWFVEFEFPDAEGRPYKSSGGKMAESEMGSVPEGWEVGKIGDICYRKRNLVEPISLLEHLPYVGLEHMPQHHMVLDRWGCSEDITSTKIAFTKNDILFGTLRPYFHKVGLSPINGICSTDILVVSPIEAEYLSLVLCYLSSDEFVVYANSASEGTRMPRAKWNHMKMYPVVLPSKEIVMLFNVIINSILSQIKRNIKMNHCLKEIQNKLLPKLMNGEIEL